MWMVPVDHQLYSEQKIKDEICIEQVTIICKQDIVLASMYGTSC